MPVGINQPSNQIKLTNVSIVRMRKGKKRFEIACYKNKISEWRNGVEKDIDNVLQIPNVFLSVSKGQVAPSQELAKAFGAKIPLNDIILEILNKGEQQVGEKERQAQLERVHNEVIDIVAGKLVDPNTKRVYTTGMIEKALDQLSTQGQQLNQSSKGTPNASGTATPVQDSSEGDRAKLKDVPVWTGVTVTKSAKSQALEAMKALIAFQPIPVSRARMRLRITCPTNVLKQAVKISSTISVNVDVEQNDENPRGTVKDQIIRFVEQIESQDTAGDEWELVGFVEPGMYKPLTELVAGQTKGRARAEVLDMAVVHEGD